jgi:glycosyltransferase involved in cell wall biosynthesis
MYGEAFGLYIIEALASGVPVVQPRHAAFPELVELTGGGMVYEPGNGLALADALEPLLLDHEKARVLGEAGRKAVREKFGAEQMAHETIEAYQSVIAKQQPVLATAS